MNHYASHITGKTKIVGVIGDPVEHTCSPQMHNAAFSEIGLDYVYVPFHVRPTDLRVALEGFKACRIIGVNVTVPYKQRVIPFLDQISQEAALIGAANTLIFKQGKITGENTDASGFLLAMKHAGHEVPRNGSAIVIGAGGSARAIAVALAREKLQSIVIANRTTSKAVALAADLADKTSAEILGMGIDDARLPNAVSMSQLIVNTASASMDFSHPLLIQPEWLTPQSIVYDIIYTPPETRLLKAASTQGCHTIGGLGMLLYQGAIAFEKWTRVSPPIDVMRRALQQALGQT